MIRRNSDPERDRLKGQLEWNTARLDAIGIERGQYALAATRGDAKAVKFLADLNAEEIDRRNAVETFQIALAAFDRERKALEDAKEAEKRERTINRRNQILDLMEKEQRANYVANIERLRASGQHRDAEIWTHALSQLRQQLEAQMPLPWRTP